MSVRLRRCLRICLGLGVLAGSALGVPPPSSAAAAAPDLAPRIDVRSLGAAVAPRTLSGVDSLTVPGVDPAADRLLLLWVMHREDDAALRPQHVVEIGHPSIEDWNLELSSAESNAQRFALYWTVTEAADPAPGDLTIRFSSSSERTLAILLEADGVDLSSGEKPFTNLAIDESFGDPNRELAGPTTKTHYLQSFVDPERNAGIAFQFAGREDTAISVEEGLDLVEHINGGPSLTSAAAFDPPGGEPDVTPTFTWTQPASSGGLALELRAEGSAPAFPIQRRALTQGRSAKLASASTQEIAATPDELLVAFVANKDTKTSPPLPSVAGPAGVSWSRTGTMVFDTVRDADNSLPKRLTAFVGSSVGEASGRTTISFPTPQTSITWFMVALSGTDLSEGALGAVRQTAIAGGDAISSADVSFLRSHGAPVNATIAAVALKGGGEPGIQPGFARAPSTRTPFPIKEGDLSLWGQWRSTPATSVGMGLQTTSDAAIVALEVKERTTPQVPAITDVAPRTVSDAGGVEVIISGSDFTDHDATPTVTFGDDEVVPVEGSVTPSRLRAVVPAGTPGTVDVAVVGGPPGPAVRSENTPEDDLTYVPRIAVADPVPVSESETSISFAVALADGATAPFPVAIDYATADGSARAGTDYERTTGTLTIPAGERSGTITVPVLGDAIDEPDEELILDLSNPQRGVITDGRALGAIVDDDEPPSVSIGGATATEGSSGTTNAVFPVSLSAPSGRDVTVAYATADETAVAGSDYQTTTGTATIPAGQTSAQILVPVIGDSIDEPDETFVVNLGAPTNATIANGQGRATIVDDDGTAPSLSISDASAIEGTGTKSHALFTVTLSSPASANVRASFATIDDTATAPHDYTARTDSLQFAVGERTKQFRITVTSDSVDEPDERFFVDLTSATGATIADGRGEGTIVDDDVSAPPALSIGDVTVAEGNGDTTTAVFTVSASAASSNDVTVAYSTADGTAAAGSDYVASSGTASIPAGTTSTTISVPVAGDAVDEADEFFFLDLSSPTNATIADGRGQGTIADDDPTPSVSIGDVTVTEGNSGTTPAVFTVSLSGASGTDVTVPYSTADDTATAGSDYSAASGTVTIPAGQTSRTLTVDVTGDTVDEPDETFFVNLGSPTGATVGDGQGGGTITDDDEPPPPPTAPELSIGDASILEGPPGTKTALRLTVTLSSPQPTTVTFSYASVDHTATAASGDYIAKSGTGTIVAGATTVTLRVDARGDAIDEPDESFFVDLSNPSGATIADGRGVGTIADDD